MKSNRILATWAVLAAAAAGGLLLPLAIGQPNTARQSVAVVKESLTTQAEPARLELPAEARGPIGSFITVQAKTNGQTVRWVILDTGVNLFPVDLLKDTRTAVVSGTKSGRYRLLAYTAVAGDASPPAICVVVIGDSPAPGPDPKPDPKPDPVSPAPIPEPGLRVLIVFETADAAKMPPSQQAILYGQEMRTYLDSVCVAGQGAREWRIWDKDVSTANAPKLWQDALKRPRQSIPWLIVSNGITGFEGPLPASVDDAKALVQKFAK